MITSENSTFKYIVTALVLLFFSCTQRENGIGIRNNPCDPGGGEWTQNSAPVITVHSDSLWEDFNNSSATGSIRLYLQMNDINFPYDTLSGSIFFNSSETKLPIFKLKKDTSLLLRQIKPNTSPACTVTITDSKGMATAKVLTVSVPHSAPPQPPSARVINSSQNTVLTWTAIPGALYYTIYYSNKIEGPFSDSIFVKQTGDSIISISDAGSSIYPRYYILSVTDTSGTSRSTDTLIGRIYSGSISTPSISSISKGSYSTHIAIQIYLSSYSNIDHLEIFRSENDTNTFRLIDTVKVSYSSYIYYNDSVSSSGTCYYKVAAISKQNTCSFPSAVKCGYLTRLSSPNVSVSQNYDYIRFSWSSVYGAVNYLIYRSDSACTGTPELLLSTTTTTTFTDTPPSSNIYYYTFSAVSSNGTEGIKSNCFTAKIDVLPKPDSVTVTYNYYPRHVALSWKKLNNAMGYIIYRDSIYSGVPTTPFDTITGTTYIDSFQRVTSYYYSIAGFNAKGIGQLSEKMTGAPVIPQILSAEGKPDSVSLRFAQNIRAVAYYIYRSLDSTTFVLIDSVSTTLYNAPLNDFNTWYYRITIATPEGISFPSKHVRIVRQLNVPSNIIVSGSDSGVHINWNKVDGAEYYDIYRSKYTNSITVFRTTTDTTFFDTLSSGSTGYYYRIAAKNSFTASALSSNYYGRIPSSPLTPSSISIYGQLYSINLSWSMPVNSSQPDGFNIYRSKDNSLFTLIDTTQSYQFFDSVPDTLRYYYRISAYNSKGESSLSATYNSALAKLSAPTGVTASLATSKDYIRITWSPVSSVTEYTIYRSLLPNGPYDYIGNVQNTFEYHDTTCNVNTDYYYVVTSSASGNQSSYSLYAKGIRLGPPEIVEIANSNSGISLVWIKLPYTVQRYLIYRADSFTGPYIKIDSTTSNIYDDISGNGNSYYKVSSFNVVESDLSTAGKHGNLNATLEVVATQGTKLNMIEISWTALDGAFAYKVYRAPTDTFDRGIIRIAEVTTTTYNDTVYSDSIYYYKITGVKTAGETGFPTVAALGFRYPTSKPLPPSYTYIWPNNSGIFMGWGEVPTSIGFTGYNVYRASSAEGPFELIASTQVPGYSDIPPQKSPAVYYYYVTTVNQMGESTPSGTESGSQKQ